MVDAGIVSFASLLMPKLLDTTLGQWSERKELMVLRTLASESLAGELRLN